MVDANQLAEALRRCKRLIPVSSDEWAEADAALAAFEAQAETADEDIQALLEARAMLTEIGLICREQTRFVGSYAEIVRQAFGALSAPVAQESQRRCSEPLTEEQAKALWNNWAKNHRAKPIDLIRAIEAAIKENPNDGA